MNDPKSPMKINCLLVVGLDAFGRIACMNKETYHVDKLEPVWGDDRLIALRDPENPQVAYVVDKGEYAAAIVHNRHLEMEYYANRN